MYIEIPPCIKKIMDSEELLKKYYIHVLRFFYNYKQESYLNMLDLITRTLKNVTIGEEVFKPFECTDLRDIVEYQECKECPLYNDVEEIVDRLIKDTKEVYISEEDDKVILTVLLNNGKVIELNYTSDKLGRELASKIALIYRIHIDLDLRRKRDREILKKLLDYWIRRAKDADFNKMSKIKLVNEDKMYIRDLALNYIYTAPVRPLDNWLENPACAVVLSDSDKVEEVEEAYILKEAVLNYVSSKIGKRLSFKYLTQLLKPEVEPVRIMINGYIYNFYKFRMTEEQKQGLLAFIKEVKEAEEHKKKEQEEKNELSEEYDEWDLSDLLNKE